MADYCQLSFFYEIVNQCFKQVSPFWQRNYSALSSNNQFTIV